MDAADSEPLQLPASEHCKVRHETAPRIVLEGIDVPGIYLKKCLAHLRTDFKVPRPNGRPQPHDEALRLHAHGLHGRPDHPILKPAPARMRCRDRIAGIAGKN
jgi:hypothetical protein